jgi:hypothetical protein
VNIVSDVQLLALGRPLRLLFQDLPEDIHEHCD